MRNRFRVLSGCILCMAAISSTASASVTITGTPTITMTPPSSELIAINQTVTIDYDDELTFSQIPTTYSFSLTWNCYVGSVENANFPRSYSQGNVTTQLRSVNVGSGSFSFSEPDPGTYTVYCTAEGIATPEGLSSQSISGTTKTITFEVVSCTGEISSMNPYENPDEPASYIQLRWTINATMNPAYSGSQSPTTNWYQGIDGDLTNHSPNLDIDCQDENNTDPPPKEPTIAVASQAPGSGEVTFTFNVQEWDYSWDVCDQNTCPPPPPDGVENVQVIPLALQNPQFTFQCGK